MNTITVYTTPECSFCRRAKEVLEQHGYSSRLVDITTDPGAMDEFIRRTRHARTVPQVLVGETLIGGYEDLRLQIATPRFQQLAGGF